MQDEPGRDMGMPDTEDLDRTGHRSQHTAHDTFSEVKRPHAKFAPRASHVRDTPRLNPRHSSYPWAPTIPTCVPPLKTTPGVRIDLRDGHAARKDWPTLQPRLRCLKCCLLWTAVLTVVAPLRHNHPSAS